MKHVAAAIEARRKKDDPAHQAQLKENLIKAREARQAKVRQRQLIRQKIEENMPITEAENALLVDNGQSTMSAKAIKQRAVDKAAALIIKPQNVQEMRILVDQIVQRKKYNPIEDLIDLANDPRTPIKERIAIHKSLLPFTTPALPPTPKEVTQADSKAVKVTITNFVFPVGSRERPEVPLHEQKPVTVDTITEATEIPTP
jgi:hypothetical protein